MTMPVAFLQRALRLSLITLLTGLSVLAFAGCPASDDSADAEEDTGQDVNADQPKETDQGTVYVKQPAAPE